MDNIYKQIENNMKELVEKAGKIGATLDFIKDDVVNFYKHNELTYFNYEQTKFEEIIDTLDGVHLLERFVASNILRQLISAYNFKYNKNYANSNLLNYITNVRNDNMRINNYMEDGLYTFMNQDKVNLFARIDDKDLTNQNIIRRIYIYNFKDTNVSTYELKIPLNTNKEDEKNITLKFIKDKFKVEKKILGLRYGDTYKDNMGLKNVICSTDVSFTITQKDIEELSE